MSFADGFRSGASVVADIKRLKADKEERALRAKERSEAIAADLSREERQQKFQRELLQERMHSDLQRQREERMAKQEDDFRKTLEAQSERVERQPLLNAQIAALGRQGIPQPRQEAPSPFQQKIKDFQAYEGLEQDGIKDAIAALATNDMEKIQPTQQRLSTIAGMNPNQPAPVKPEMAEVEIPYGPMGADEQPAGKARYKAPVDEIRATMQQMQGAGPAMGQVAPKPDNRAMAAERQRHEAAAQWARQNPTDPRAKALLAKSMAALQSLR